MNELDLSNRTYVVTGATGGIGEAVCDDLVGRGAFVFALDARPSESTSPSVQFIECDVTSEASVDAAADQIALSAKSLSGLVQCVGITRDAVHWKLSPENWRRVIDVNLTGAFLVQAAMTPLLRRSASASIVNIASINGIRGKFGQSNYSASKAGLIAFTKTVARELGAFNIRCNAIAPGWVETAMTADLSSEQRSVAEKAAALGRTLQPSDIAGSVTFLLSDLSASITGQVLSVDGGVQI